MQIKVNDITVDLHPATKQLVIDYANALADKLLAAEHKYGRRDDWMTQDWEDECREKLMDHIKKGDPLDVAAYSAFMWKRGWSTKEPSQSRNYSQLFRPASIDKIQEAKVSERVMAAKLEAAFILAGEINLRKRLVDALKALVEAVKSEPAMNQGRKYDQLGVQVYNALDAAEFAPKQWECAGRKQTLPEPSECNWPVCGCDPYAEKVVISLLDSGAVELAGEDAEAEMRLAIKAWFKCTADRRPTPAALGQRIADIASSLPANLNELDRTWG